MATHHIHVAGVKLRRDHVRNFLAYSGMVLMAFDAVTAMFIALYPEHLAKALETWATYCGKTGAVASSATVFFERAMQAIEKV